MITVLLAPIVFPALPFISPVFGDHMVLQRGKLNTVWGWTEPGQEVSVSYVNESTNGVITETGMFSTHAAEDGKWTLKLRPPKKPGPYKLTIKGPQTVEFHDVLVGDVWVCSGQSNMEMGISQAKDAAAEIKDAANYPNIRLFAVPKKPALTKQASVSGQWLTCSSENIVKGGWGGFSAVAYYFGRKLNQDLGVPIGLVHTSWGGTPAEAWTSAEGIAPVKDFDRQANAVTEMAKPNAKHTADIVQDWANANGNNWSGAAVDDSGWATVNLPARFSGMGLNGYRGTVWLRKTIELPDPVPGGDVQLTTGSNDGVDMNYVNGVRTDFGSSVLNWRNKPVPPGVLKPGKNVIAIRFVGTSGNPGFTFGGQDGLNLRIGGKVISLVGEWKMKKDFELTKDKPMPDLVEDNPYWPTTLYNGMLYPLMPMGIKGAIWYQGETNVGRGEQYSRLLPAMITDWRKGFGQGDFPFFVVQLANFGGQSPTPRNSSWAELREAQAIAVRRVKNAGLATTIDIGEGADIHPKNKQDVGKRLALSALKVAYGKSLEYSGPVFQSAKSKGATLVVKFDHAKGLNLRAGKHSGFAVAGADGKFVWAEAEVVGDTVELSAATVPSPVDVRYAWDDDPVVTLFNGDGLPAVPFRTR